MAAPILIPWMFVVMSPMTCPVFNFFIGSFQRPARYSSSLQEIFKLLWWLFQWTRAISLKFSKTCLPRYCGNTGPNDVNGESPRLSRWRMWSWSTMESWCFPPLVSIPFTNLALLSFDTTINTLLRYLYCGLPLASAAGSRPELPVTTTRQATGIPPTSALFVDLEVFRLVVFKNDPKMPNLWNLRVALNKIN